MNSIAKVFGNFKDYCLNNSTTTIDVIVIEQPDGEILSSPFHLCIDITAFINDGDYKFQMKINGKQTGLQLGYIDTGEACILEEASVIVENSPPPTVPTNQGEDLVEENIEELDKDSFKEVELIDSNMDIHNSSNESVPNSGIEKPLNVGLKKCKSLPSIQEEKNSFPRASSERFVYKQDAHVRIYEDHLKAFNEMQKDSGRLDTSLIGSKKNFRSDGDILNQLEPNEGKTQITSDEAVSLDNIFKDDVDNGVSEEHSSSAENISNQHKKSTISWLLKALLDVIRISTLTKKKLSKDISKSTTNTSVPDSNTSEDELQQLDVSNNLSSSNSFEIVSQSSEEAPGNISGSNHSLIEETLDENETQKEIEPKPESECVASSKEKPQAPNDEPKSFEEPNLKLENPEDLEQNKAPTLDLQNNLSKSWSGRNRGRSLEQKLGDFKCQSSYSKSFQGQNFMSGETDIIYLNQGEMYQSCNYLNQEFLAGNLSLTNEDVKLLASLNMDLESIETFEHDNFSCSCDTESFDENKFLSGIFSSGFDLQTVGESNQSPLLEVCQSASIEQFLSTEGDDLIVEESQKEDSLDGLGASSLDEDSDAYKKEEQRVSSGIGSSDATEELFPNDPPSKDQQFVALSLCGIEGKTEITTELFAMHRLTFHDLCKQPELFYSPKLVVRVNDQYYPWSTAAPLITLYVMSGKEPPRETLEKLKKLSVGNMSTRSKSDNSTKRSWWLWRSKTNSKANKDKILVNETNELEEPKPEEKYLERDEISCKSKDAQLEVCGSSLDFESFDILSNMEGQTDDSKSNQENKIEERYQYSYNRMFRISSNVLKKLDLHQGKNLMEFTIASNQGTVNYKCFIYLWNYFDKIIVSDIDGTITKSDVLGHLLPMVGKDWSQSGVAPLFNKIAQNGYKILYLSSRAWNQVKNTRDYINWVRQDNISLPDGPILLSPDSMFDTLHRELVDKKPELFKIACLNDIRTLFPDRNPFYAGYGNRLNDVIAYQNVGIPQTRIFTVNHKGEIAFLTHNSLRSSYLNMINIVDFIFSPSGMKDDCNAHEFVQSVYWRDPIYDMPFSEKGHRSQSPRSRSFRFPFSN